MYSIEVYTVEGHLHTAHRPLRPLHFSFMSSRSSLLFTIYTEYRINQANAFASALHPASTGYKPRLASVQLGTSHQILFIQIALISLFQKSDFTSNSPHPMCFSSESLQSLTTTFEYDLFILNLLP